MAIEIWGKSGVQVLQDGALAVPRLLKDATMGVSDVHGRYQEAAYRGNLFVAANQAGTAVTNLNSTATGVILTNPIASGKLLSIIEVGFAATAAPGAATTLQLAANVNPVAATVVHTTPITIRNMFLGAGANAVGLADSAATLPASPVAILNLASPALAASEITPVVMVFDIAGKVIVGQGCAVSLSALAAVTGVGHIVWEEINP